MTKLELAYHQLDRAFILFAQDRDYISAITLAGAAEEILGCLVRHGKNGRSAAIDEEIELVSAIMRGQGGIPIEKEVREALTFARNALKHRNVGGRTDAEFDLREEAEMIIDRAVENYEALTEWWPDSSSYDEYRRARNA